MNGFIMGSEFQNTEKRTERLEIKVVEVVAAVFQREGKILIARKKEGKPLAGLWEFPGGKIEKSESPEQALVREIQEELQVNIEVGGLIAKNSHSQGSVIIELSAYWVNSFSGEIQLKDHDQMAWVDANSWRQYDMAPADIPLIDKAVRNLPLQEANFRGSLK